MKSLLSLFPHKVNLLLRASNCLHGMPGSTRVMGLFLSDWREARNERKVP